MNGKPAHHRSGGAGGFRILHDVSVRAIDHCFDHELPQIDAGAEQECLAVEAEIAVDEKLLD